MLSRIAESLFWIGRYVERADGTARIVDVLRLQLLEDPGTDEEVAADTVLSVIMGLQTPEGAGMADVGQHKPALAAATVATARATIRQMVEDAIDRMKLTGEVDVPGIGALSCREASIFLARNARADSVVCHDIPPLGVRRPEPVILITSAPRRP